MLTFEEQLIAEVVKFPAIYDTNSRDYKDSEAKESAWRQVTGSLKQPELKCKSRWKSLRDSFVCAIKRQGAHGANGRQRKPWRFQKQMEFLLPYITVRKPQSPLIESGDSLGPPSVEDFDEDDNKVYDSEAMAVATHFMSRQQPPSSVTSSLPPAAPEEALVALTTPETTSTPCNATAAVPAGNTEPDWEEIPAPPAVALAAKQHPPPAPTQHPPRSVLYRDPINLFFESMAETVKRLPIEVQCRIKLELCRMVCEAEIAAALHHHPVHFDLLHAHHPTNTVQQNTERQNVNGLQKSI